MASSDVDFMEAPVKHVISVKKEKAKFGGAVFLPDGKLLVADKDNCRLLLFEDDFFYQQEFKLPDKPYDITIGSDQKIYVTMFKNKLLKCEIDGDDLNILQTYDAPAGTYYLDAFNDQLVACCSGAFKILDSDGKEVQSFKTDCESPIAVSTKQKDFTTKHVMMKLLEESCQMVTKCSILKMIHCTACHA
ncbi:TRIM71 [Mytilus edulis]|uniref:TRIM71 n=1 Tax=Mytilus edulis TaxID=6550 RepID=A0A8S3R4B5_MYTED|nr:TRIM71 [Mytilus edulis]